MFSCEFREISKNSFSTKHLRTTASEISCLYKKECKVAPNWKKYIFSKNRKVWLVLCIHLLLKN